MSVRILQPGLLTTVQDLGRFGFQKFGLSASGAMDPYAAAIANILVGNDRDCAVLEYLFLGPQDHMFSPRTVQSFFNAEYTVTDKPDRIGCGLSGPVSSSNCS